MTRSKLSQGFLSTAACVLVACLAAGCGSKKEPAPDKSPPEGQKSGQDTAAPEVVTDTPRVPDNPPAPLEADPSDPAAHKGTHVWSRGFGSDQTDAVKGVAIDPDGDVAVVGYFRGSVDFGDGTARTAAETDAFVARFGPDGAPRWTVTLGSKDEDIAHAVAFTGDGGLVAVGQFAYEADAGEYELTSAGSDDAFALKINEDGVVTWAFRLGGTDSDAASGVAVDAAGNVYVTGSFKRGFDVGEVALKSVGNEDIFVLKLTAAGELAWVQQFGGRYQDAGERLAVDSRGNVVLLARFRGEVAFGGDPLQPEGNQDLAVVKLDPDGKHLWSQRFGSPFNELGLGLAVDPADHIAFTGSFDQEIEFGDVELKSAGESDVFVARLGPDGKLSWVKQFGGGREDIGAGVAVDRYGNLVVTGVFRGKVDFGGGALESPETNKDVFLLKLTPEGSHLWSKRFGDRDHDQGRGVAVNPAGQIALVGIYRFDLNLGGAALSSARKPDDKAPPPDGFVAVFAP